jgi:hypothetical protein
VQATAAVTHLTAFLRLQQQAAAAARLLHLHLFLQGGMTCVKTCSVHAVAVKGA